MTMTGDIQIMTIPTTPPLVLSSHGVKRLQFKDEETAKRWWVIPQCDFVVDCRGIQEHGLHRNQLAIYQEEIKTHSPISVDAMVASIADGLRHVGARRNGEKDALTKPYRIVFICAYGVNRSRTTKYVVGARLKQLGYTVTILEEGPAANDESD